MGRGGGNLGLGDGGEEEREYISEDEAAVAGREWGP
jgi:hypothetical protein